MKRLAILVACLALLLGNGVQTTKASAAVAVSLQIGDPYRGPRLAFVQQPDIVVIPGTRVYYVEDTSYDLYRYGPYWYYYYDGGWYRSRDYDGPFYFISYQTIPGPIRYVPVQYRHHWRSYRGPAYTYYRSGRWYRQNPGPREVNYSYARPSGRRDVSNAPSRGYGQANYERGQAASRGPSEKGRANHGGNGKGKGQGNGKNGQGHDHGN